MKKQIRKRIAAIVLCICMLFTLLPTVAFADSADSTAPTLTTGEVIRTNDTTASVKFTSNEVGTYYYNIGGTVTNTTTGGAICTTSETTLYLNTLTAGVKDIYIVVKDVAGNLSDSEFKITLPSKTYYVSFDKIFGTGSISYQTFGAEMPQALNANTFTREGYTFAGWNTSGNGKGTSYADGAIYTATAGITLYAQWAIFAVLKSDGKCYITNSDNTSPTTTLITDVKTITNLFVDTGVTTIADSAFYQCKALTTVKMPDVVTIGTRAFQECSALTAVEMPKITAIGDLAFYQCSMLATVKMPVVNTIGIRAFARCFALTSFEMPVINTINEGVFEQCKALTAADMPNVKSIGKDSFFECSSLTTVKMPEATTIGAYAFYYCAFANVEMPKVISIGGFAFINCKQLTTVKMPEVTTISDNAFDGDTALTTVEMPKITTIGILAFQNCTALANLTVGTTPPSIPSIVSIPNSPNDVFKACLRTKLTIEGNINSPVIASYKAALDGNTSDNLWLGWSLPSLTTNTVTYSCDDETSGNVPIDSGAYANTDSVTLLGNTGNLVREDYTFAGWSDGTNTYKPGASYTMTSNNVTFTAQWVVTPAITAGIVTRKSDTEATIEFTSNKTGTYYYNLSSAVTDTTAVGTHCTAGEAASITLTNLTKGAYYVYIRVKDDDGYLSVNTYKIIIPGTKGELALARNTGLDFTVTALSYIKQDGTLSTANPLNTNITDSGEGWAWYVSGSVEVDGKNYTAPVLVLSDANIIEPNYSGLKQTGIKFRNATLVLAAGTTNTVILRDMHQNFDCYGIFCTDIRLAICGTGTLNVTGAGQGRYCYAIYGGASSSITISDSTIYARSGNGSDYNVAIYAGSLTVYSGTITAQGGDSTKNQAYSRGIDATTFTVSGGTINAIGGKAPSSGGITGVNIEVTGGTINATGSEAIIRSYGIGASISLHIFGGNVTAIGGKSNGGDILSASYGIIMHNSNLNTNYFKIGDNNRITSPTVTAKGGEANVSGTKDNVDMYSGSFGISFDAATSPHILGGTVIADTSAVTSTGTVTGTRKAVSKQIGLSNGVALEEGAWDGNYAKYSVQPYTATVNLTVDGVAANATTVALGSSETDPNPTTMTLGAVGTYTLANTPGGKDYYIFVNGRATGMGLTDDNPCPVRMFTVNYGANATGSGGGAITAAYDSTNTVVGNRGVAIANGDLISYGSVVRFAVETTTGDTIYWSGGASGSTAAVTVAYNAVKVQVTCSLTAPAVTFSSAVVDGAAGSASTTKVTLTLSRDITGLAVSDITLNPYSTGASKGTLTRINTGVYELSLTGIKASGTIRVSLSKSGYSFSPSYKDVSVVYYYSLSTYTVGFAVIGSNGKLSATVDNTAISSGAAVQNGKSVIFNALPNSNYRVKQWKLNGAIVTENISNTYTLSSLSANSTVTVEFEAIPANSYTVTMNNGGIGSTGSGTYAAAATVALTPGTKAGYTFTGWSTAPVVTITANQFTMPASNVTITANWTADTLTGTVTITGTEKYNQQLTVGVSSTNNTGTLSYQWKRGTANLLEATKNTYTTVAADVGQTLSCVITSSDQTGSITGTTGTIGKADQAAPNAPTASVATYNTITLITVAGCEYSFNDTSWQMSPIFTGLTAKTAYNFYQRKAETEVYNASPSSADTTKITTTDVPDNSLNGTVAIIGKEKYNETLTASVSGTNNTGMLSYQWKRGTANIIGATKDTYKTVAADVGQILTCVITSTIESGSISGTSGTIGKADQDAPAAPTAAAKTHSEVTLNTVDSCEYSLGGTSWQTSPVFSGLENNTNYAFYQRLPETAIHKASPASDMTNVTTNRTFTINGKVTDDKANPLSDAAIKLVQGNRIISQTVTDKDGKFTITGIPRGVYNLVVIHTDGTIVTVKLEISTEDFTFESAIVIPTGKKSSIVEVTGTGTPDVVVGGLDNLYHSTSNTTTDYTLVDEAVVTSGGSIELKLVAEKKAEADVTADSVKISAVASNKSVRLYIDFSVLKTVVDSSGLKTADGEKVPILSGIIEIVLPLPTELQGKTGLTVYRVHDNTAEALPNGVANQNADGEYFTISDDGTYITMHVKKFSTYALAVDPDTNTITASNGVGGTISPSGSATVNNGSSKSFTITPNSGYTIADVLVDGVSVGAVTSYTFSNITSNHTISASFNYTGGGNNNNNNNNTSTYTITASAGTNGTISPSGSVTVNNSSSKSFTITPNSGYSIAAVLVDGVSVDVLTSYTFSNVVSNHTISVSFKATDEGNDGNDKQPTNHKPVFVDINDEKKNIGDETEEDDTTTVITNQDTLPELIKKAKNGDNITIQITENTTGVLKLVVANVEDMAAKNLTLTIKTGKVAYNIKMKAVDTKAISAAFLGIPTTAIPFIVTITKSKVKVTVANVVVSPIDFTIVASYGGKTVQVERFSAFVNRTVEITAEQAKKITTAVVVEKDGSLRHVPTNVKNDNGKYYAIINSLTNSTYTLINNDVRFSDVGNKWYNNVANEMASRKIVTGIGSNCFAGDKAITRAEFVMIIVKALGLPTNGKSTFTDVASNTGYSGAIATAAQYGIALGIGNNKFNPNAKITRQEGMQMIYNASKLMTFPALSNARNLTAAFTDYGKQSAWATEAVNFNLNNNLIIGSKDGNFRPKYTMSRAEVATVVLKLLQRAELVDVRSKI